MPSAYNNFVRVESKKKKYAKLTPQARLKAIAKAWKGGKGKAKKGAGLFSKIYKAGANFYRKRFCPKGTRKLEEGEYHPGCENFTGPGTNLVHRDVKPVSDVDRCSKKHDLDYEAIGRLPKSARASAVHRADAEVLACYKRARSGPRGLARAGIGIKHGAEKFISKLRGKPTALYGGGKRMPNWLYKDYSY